MAKLNQNEVKNIQRKMIRMLKNKKKYGGTHTETINLRNCVPKHLRGERIVDEAISDLFKKEILINKKSTGESHYSLNSQKLREIESIEHSQKKNPYKNS